MSPAFNVRLLAVCGAAATVMISATPALAQEMDYEERVYEYARPLPQGEPQPMPPAVAHPVYVRQEVVQDIPAESYDDYEGYEDGYDSGYHEDDGGDGYYTGAGYAGADYARPAPPPPHPGYPHYQAYPPAGYAGPQGDYGYQSAYPPMPPVVDRDAWIADCRAYLRERRRQGDRGAVAGGLLGAVAGGVAGNRIADGERLGGTLIGAGVGGLVGLFIGQAIALAGGDGTKKDCKNWLRTYEDSYARGGQWPAQGYYPYPGPMWGGWDGRWQQSGAWQSGWSSGSWGGWSGGYVVVPMTTVVITEGPQMVPVVREVVRERWVEEEVVTYREVTPPAPKPKVRYIKTKPAPKPIKYRKGG